VPDEQSLLGTPPDFWHLRSCSPRDLIFSLFFSGASSLCVLPPDTYSLEDRPHCLSPGDQIRRHEYHLARDALLLFSQQRPHLLRAPATQNGQPPHVLQTVPPLGWTYPETASWITPWPPDPGDCRSCPGVPCGCLVGRAPCPDAECVSSASIPAARSRALTSSGRLRCSFWQPIDIDLLGRGKAREAETLGARAAVLGNWWAVQARIAAEMMVGFAT